MITPHKINMTQKAPRFGHHLGLWYPLIWRILASNKYWSPSMWLPKDSALAIDIYIGIWWIIESLCIFSGSFFFHWKGIGLWVIVGIAFFRFFDIMFVLSSILVKGFYRKQQEDWPSLNRITLLVILNAFELMIIFALFFRAFGILTPNIASTSPTLNSYFDALYFSVVTGISLGYGIPHPTGWLSRLLSMIEASSIFIVVIAVISYITSGKRKLEDKEHKHFLENTD